MEFILIGTAHTPLKTSSGAPVQPRMAKDIRGRIEVLPEYADALSDLDGFERIWLLSWLDRSRDPQMKVVPYMDDTQRGLFSTRAPSRPNPIGMSCVRLLKLDGCTLHVEEIDLLDGTPILDIKPYSPKFDSYPDARAGWLEKLEREETPKGVADKRFEKE